MNKKVIAIAGDCEFTSFDRIGGDIITTGLVEIYEDFTLGREKEIKSRPRSSKYFTSSAQEKHGISYWTAVTFQDPKASCLEMLEWLKPFKGQQLPFIFHATGGLDWKWLESHFEKEEMKEAWTSLFPQELYESTLDMAKKNLIELESKSLDSIAKFYGIELNHHDALSDARACAQIYCNIKKKVNTWTGEFDL